MSKKKPDSKGFVYSTDPNFQFEEKNSDKETLSPARQRLKIRLDAKQRASKVVTLIEGFIGRSEDIEELAKKLKNFCGTGGSAKDGEIIIQGDQREKAMQWLLKNGYVNVKRI